MAIVVLFTLLIFGFAFRQSSIDCTNELKNITNYFLTDPAVPAFLWNSGKGVNDFGFYQDCIDTNTSKYYMLMIVITAGVSFDIGLCLPKQCNSTDLDSFKGPMASALSSVIKMNITKEMIYFIDSKSENDKDSAMNGYRWVSIFVLIALLIFTVIGAYCEQSTTKLGVIMGSFSIRKNAKALLYSENRVDKNLDVLNGVRVLSMGWVVLGHAFVMFMYIPSLNSTDLLHTLTTSTAIGTITGGTFSVDSFFCLSGFLACMALTQQFSNESNRKASVVIIAIVKRLIRLYPIYIALFILAFNIMPLLGNGPVYYQSNTFLTTCRTNWWYNILFIDNFQKSTSMCFSWTWYIANDMQFFIVLIPICIVYCINKLAGSLIALALIIASHTYNFLVVYINKYPVYDPDISKINECFEKVYYPPWCRISAYLIGVYFGWLYLGNKNAKYKTNLTESINNLWKNSAAMRYLLYVVGFGLITFFTYSYTYFFTHEGVAEIWSVLYYTFARLFYTFGLLFIIYPVTIGRGKPLLAFLGNPLFNSLAKITYAVYQVHLLIFSSYFLSTQQGVEYQGLYIVTKAIDVFVTSYLAAFVLTLLFESPIVQLEKLIFPPPKRDIAIEDKTTQKQDTLKDDEVALSVDTKKNKET